MFFPYIFIIFFVSLAFSLPTLEGSCDISPQDYYGLPRKALANNPPFCGMPYNQLNLARITAVQVMNSTTCNLCLRVRNPAHPKRILHVLAVDLGGSGLDLSTPSFKYLFDQGTDRAPATWSTVDDSFCDGIFTPGKVNLEQGVGSPTIQKTVSKKLGIIKPKKTFIRKNEKKTAEKTAEKTEKKTEKKTSKKTIKKSPNNTHKKKQQKESPQKLYEAAWNRNVQQY